MTGAYNAAELRHVRRLLVVAAVALAAALASIILILTDNPWPAAAAWVTAATLGALATRSGLRLHTRVEARWQEANP